VNGVLGVEGWAMAGTAILVAVATVLIRVYWRRSKRMGDK
jgi:hypothetical protein